MWFQKENDPDFTILIPYEDDDNSRFNCVGVHGDLQFMALLTGATTWDEKLQAVSFAFGKRWYGVLHLFDMAGNHQRTITYLGGTDGTGKVEACNNAFNQLNKEVLAMDNKSPLQYCNIHVKPFIHPEDEYLFGLVYYNEPSGDGHAVLWPNDIYFQAPWNGRYST